ncbi:MAG: outer membrane protein assembly factor BamB [Arsenophonus sp.]
MKLNRTFSITLFVIILLIGCSVEKDYIKVYPLPIFKNKFNPSIIWYHKIGDGIGENYSQLSPVYNDSIVYAADRKGTIKSIDIGSGKILWSINLSKKKYFFTRNRQSLLSSGLTVSGNKIYIGTETGKIIALNKIDGELVWETDISGEVLSKPIIDNDILLIHTGNGLLHALNSHTGQNKWSIDLGTSGLSIRGKSTPTIVYGIAIVGSNTGRISAINISEGQILWQQYISEIHGKAEIGHLHDVNITPVIDIDSSTIFAIAYNGDLVSMDMYSGQIIWKLYIGSVNDMIIVNNIIYLVDQNDRVLGIYKSNGVILWTQNALLHRNLTAPIIYDNYLVVGDGEGYLHWLDINSGEFIVRNKVNSSGLQSRPIIADDKLLIQAKDGTIYLIKH